MELNDENKKMTADLVSIIHNRCLFAQDAAPDMKTEANSLISDFNININENVSYCKCI
jgi:hypothetical protein